MAFGALHCEILLVVGILLVTTAFAIECSLPASEGFCMSVRLACYPFNATQCEAAGGEYMPDRGTCGYCNVCADTEYIKLGEDRSCNVTVRTFQAGNYTIPVEALCAPPLVCSYGYNGTCVDRAECTYL